MHTGEVNTLGSETGFTALFQYATIGILVIDKSGTIEVANPSVEKIFCYKLEELIGQRVELLIPDAFKTKHATHRENYFENPKARPMGHNMDLHARKKDGTEFPVEISLGYYELDGQTIAVAFITDISKRKDAEHELFENRRKLNDEAEALKYLNEAASQLWHIENLQLGLAEILQTSIHIMGSDKGNVQLYDPEKRVLNIAVQRGFNESFLTYFKEVNAESESACGQALKACHYITVADTDIEWHGKQAQIARDNEFRSVISIPLLARDGTPIGMISTHFRQPGTPDELAIRRLELFARNSQSFIERVRVYETIKNQNQVLEDRVNERTQELVTSLEREKELNELKSRFVSMASHEFRTPLSAILSSTTLIEQYTNEDAATKRRRHTERIKSSVKNLTDILNNFLSLEKLEQSKAEVLWSEFDLEDFFDDIVDETSCLLKQGQHIVRTYNGDRKVKQDQKILRNAILNLISNASKYSGEGKDIHLDTIVTDDHVNIKVTDHGIGIPEEEQQNLFGKFYRAKNALSIQGTGLGLNIVKRYIELVRGNISFTSVSGAGTTFSIDIPNGTA